jgi:hypothetical protein
MPLLPQQLCRLWTDPAGHSAHAMARLWERFEPVSITTVIAKRGVSVSASMPT